MKNLKLFFVSSGIFLAILIMLLWYFVFGVIIKGKPLVKDFENAIWLEHAWVEDSAYFDKIPKLIADLEKYKIKYVFIHVGPIEEDGMIPGLRFRYASAFLDIAKQLSPDIRFLAWIGQLRSKLNLDSPLIRKNMAQTSLKFTQGLGFDGVHIDIEPIKDADLAFLSALNEIKNILPDDKIVSVALGKFVPFFVPLFLDLDQYNTRSFYNAVDDIADQIVVMTYETKARSPQIYSWFVAQQIVYLSNIVDQAQLFIGIPTYSYSDESEKNFPYFHPEAENISSGMKGVWQGLKNIRSQPENVSGLALYSYWETDEAEWKVFEEMWVR